MIPVVPKPEPLGFDENVRQRGLNDLRKRNIPLDQSLPEGTNLQPYWRDCLDDLHASYKGVCAYLCIFIERVTGGNSVDHFIAKSKLPVLAYEWSNYRLACSTMNSRKQDYDDVLDPFDIKPDMFLLELVSGRIYPNPALPPAEKREVEDTIKRLGLDDPLCRKTRVEHYEEYVKGSYNDVHLKKRSPFVWHEAKRQELL